MITVMEVRLLVLGQGNNDECIELYYNVTIIVIKHFPIKNVISNASV